MVMLGAVEAVPMRRRRWEVSYKAVLHKARRELAIGGRECTCDLSSTRAGTEKQRLSGGCRMQHVRWRGRCRGWRSTAVACLRWWYCTQEPPGLSKARTYALYIHTLVIAQPGDGMAEKTKGRSTTNNNNNGPSMWRLESGVDGAGHPPCSWRGAGLSSL